MALKPINSTFQQCFPPDPAVAGAKFLVVTFKVIGYVYIAQYEGGQRKKVESLQRMSSVEYEPRSYVYLDNLVIPMPPDAIKDLVPGWDMNDAAQG